VIFGMKHKKRPKTMREITVSKAGMTWWFGGISNLYTSCCYSIFDPCFDNFSEKIKNSKKTMKTQKNAFLIYLHRF